MAPFKKCRKIVGLGERIYTVDDDGNFIGSGLRDELHTKATSRRHAAVIALVVDGNRVLVQWRAKAKLGGNRLDVSATTHVREGENYLKALDRCLQHELGITKAKSEHLLDFNYEEELGDSMENEYCKVYKVTFKGKPRLNRDEADFAEYVDLHELKKRAGGNPSELTKWLRETLSRIENL